MRDSHGKKRERFQFLEVNSSTWAISGYYITHPSIQTHGHMNESRLFSRSSGVSRGFVGQEGCYNVDTLTDGPDKASAPRSTEKH